ncbi:MAG: TonB-dependent receptor [Bacteroidetes bacterium]|nr:TonB-dependent receptor [Bacteroidota bacterium]
MKLFIYLLMVCLPTMLLGHEVKGTIYTEQNKPIPDVYIIHQASQNYALSNELGKFSLTNVAEGDTIYVSHIGYKSKTIVLSDLSQELNISLEEQQILIDEITIAPRLDAINLFSEIDVQVAPVSSSQEILTKVPGLVIGQHAGGGKAEQIFLRGFDIDHGTDIAISMDGMPVNMVSHAHGQGYADLHFLIPEVIDKIKFGKGSYYADKGNFATAGYVDFRTKDHLEESTIKIEGGQFHTFRLLGMLNLLDRKGHSAYVASEFITMDGPYDSPQNFNRINVMAKYTARLDNKDKISLLFSYFTSSWDASGQIPQRAVDAGLISRFGAIDDNEGGQTGRINAIIDYEKRINDNSFVKNTLTYSHYDFELYSNFTFFLEDSINGDEIKQKEIRNQVTMSSEYNNHFSIGKMTGLLKVGAGLRNDMSNDNELSRTLQRKTLLENIQLGDINETNFYGYIHAEFKLGKWLLNPGMRIDHFNFKYNDALAAEYDSQTAQKITVSPKLNILFNPTTNLQLYLKTGKGFHSNDTRVSVAQNGKKILPSSYGADIGVILKPIPKLLINVGFWQLFLEQEFVYVGDAGIVEPSGKTNRLGVDFGFRYQPVKWLVLDTDVNYAYARSTQDPKGENYIPLAPDLTLSGAISMDHEKGFFSAIKYRYLKDRPANEDNSIVAMGYLILDLNVGYRWKNLSFGFEINNLLNSNWNETQFATESRLKDEVEPVEEIHFTPGTPFFIKGNIKYSF